MKIYPEFEKFFPGSYSNHWKLYYGIINRFLKKYELSPTFKKFILSILLFKYDLSQQTAYQGC